MGSTDSSTIRVQIERTGKPLAPGVASLTIIGQVQIVKEGRIPRTILTRDPARFDISVDEDDPALVIDGRRFPIDANDVDAAYEFIARALQGRSGLNTAASDSPTSSSHSATQPSGPTRHQSLSQWATRLLVVSFIFGVLGVAGGLILAIQTEDTGFSDTEYPFLGLGLGVAFNSAFFALIGIVVAKTAEAVAASPTTTS